MCVFPMDQTARKQCPGCRDPREMAGRVNEGLASLIQVCGDLGLRDHAENLKAVRGRMEDRVFTVGVMGEFLRGRSTLIDSLLGKEILPTDVIPCSAVPAYIRWGEQPRAVVHFKDGTEQEIGIGDLSSYVTMLTEESEAVSATVEDAVVYYPCEFCRNGAEIVDTPGFNNEERINEIGRAVIPRLDAAVMVFSAGSPFSTGEAELVRKMLINCGLRRIIFLVNRIDIIRDPEVLRRVLDTYREKIQNVVDETAAAYGADRGAREGVRVLGVSAVGALAGRLDGSSQMVEESGILEFEKALSHLLAEERAALDLTGPVNSMMSVVKEARKSIAARRYALELDTDELERFTGEIGETVRAGREQKTREVEALRSRAAALTARLQSELEAAYDDIERRLVDHAENAHIAWHPLNHMASVREFLKNTEALIRRSFSEEMGRLMAKLRDQAVRDAEHSRDTVNEIAARLDPIEKRLAPLKKDGLVDRDAAAADALISKADPGRLFNDWEKRVLPDVIKNAFVAMRNAPILFPGMMASPHLLHALLLTSVRQAMNTVRTQRATDQWLADTIANVYDSMTGRIVEEIENRLMGLVGTLDRIVQDRQRTQSGLAAGRAGMNELENQLNNIEETIRLVRNRLA